MSNKLKAAVEALYYAAYWHPDRECDADKLWADVKLAAGFKDGDSVKRLGPPRGTETEKLRAALKDIADDDPSGKWGRWAREALAGGESGS